MITITSILQEILEPTREYQIQVDLLKKQGAKFLGSGDGGAAYELDGVVKKVTTDEVELEHAEILKGKTTKFFVPILDVDVIDTKLGIITMPILQKYEGLISKEFLENLKYEAESLGIDPTELDIKSDNFMKDKDGHLRMVDV